MIGPIEAAIREVFVERPPDPLERLLDPEFTEELWEYERSHIGVEIPGNLHGKQQAALDAVARHKWLFWGNQVGKTTWGAVNAALWALGRHPQQKWEPPITGWASGLSWNEWETILLPELLTWIPPHRIIDAPVAHAKSTKRTIRILADNGTESKIIGKSGETGRAMYQGARIHFFWMDEEHPLSIWQEVMPRLVRFGGVTIATMTPLLGLTWVHDHHYEPWTRDEKRDTYCSHAGLADNPSIDEEEIGRIKREFEGDPAQLAARLEGKFSRPSGLGIDFDRNKHMQSWPAPALKHALEERNWTQYCGIDFGWWRFAFVHLAVDHAGRSHLVAEYFSQCEHLDVRAKWIHEHLTRHGASSRTRIWGDSANPTDTAEINKELKRLDSPYRVRGVSQERKLRDPSVTKINNLLARGALLIRRNIGELMRWRLGQNAASEGRPILGSRLLWEVNNWRYPAPKDPGEKAQVQTPDDDTADGADLIAALRYAIMSYYTPPKVPRIEKPKDPNIDTRLDELDEQLKRRIRQ